MIHTRAVKITQERERERENGEDEIAASEAQRSQTPPLSFDFVHFVMY